MGGIQSLSREFTDEFSSLDGPSKVKGLMDLVKLTPYQYRQQFVDDLNKLLYKDPLAFLPAELSAKILAYLPLPDVAACLLVSKRWNDVATHCDSYWERTAVAVGVSQAVRWRTLRRYDTLKALCVAALRQQNRIGRLVPAVAVVSKCPSLGAFVYAGNGVLLLHGERDGLAQVRIEKASAMGTVVPIASYELPAFGSRVKWAAAWNDRLLWKQADGTWNGCSTDEPGPKLERWLDDPVGERFFDVSVCHNCGLVTMVTDAEDDHEMWDVYVLRMTPGESHPNKLVYPFALGQVKRASTDMYRYCLGGKITVISDSGVEREATGFCQSHRLLLQVGSCVAVHTLSTVSSEDYPAAVLSLLPDVQLSKPHWVLRPQAGDEDIEAAGNGREPEELFYTQPAVAAAFCVARDGSRVAIVYRRHLHVWNLWTYEKEASTKLVECYYSQDTRCVALGDVYALLASETRGVCSVVVVHTGRVLVECKLRDPDQARGLLTRNYSFYPSLEEDWLSAVGRVYVKSWPLAMVWDCSDGGEFVAVFGTSLEQNER